MPTYDYACADCGEFDALRSLADRNEPCACPWCGTASRRVFVNAPRLACTAPQQRRACGGITVGAAVGTGIVYADIHGRRTAAGRALAGIPFHPDGIPCDTFHFRAVDARRVPDAVFGKLHSLGTGVQRQPILSRNVCKPFRQQAHLRFLQRGDGRTNARIWVRKAENTPPGGSVQRTAQRTETL